MSASLPVRRHLDDGRQVVTPRRHDRRPKPGDRVMGEVNREGIRSGAQASERAQAQRRRREEERRQAKRLSRKSHHDGRAPDHKRSR